MYVIHHGSLFSSCSAQTTLSRQVGGEWPPVHFCFRFSETVRYMAMRFWDIVQDSEGYIAI